MCHHPRFSGIVVGDGGRPPWRPPGPRRRPQAGPRRDPGGTQAGPRRAQDPRTPPILGPFLPNTSVKMLILGKNEPKYPGGRQHFHVPGRHRPLGVKKCTFLEFECETVIFTKNGPFLPRRTSSSGYVNLLPPAWVFPTPLKILAVCF